MSRCPAQVRQAVEADAAELAELWSGLTRRGSHTDTLLEARAAIQRTVERTHERIIVAVHLGSVVGAAHLARGGGSPIACGTGRRGSHISD